MEIAFVASSSGPTVNEDFVCATSHVVVVVSGAPSDHDSGCAHGTPWFVRRLGTELVDLFETPSGQTPLNDLAQAIVNVSALHMSTCALGTSGGPSATVAVLRERDDTIEYMLLGDTAIVLDGPSGTRLLHHDAVGIRPVSSDPVVAHHAMTGSLPSRSLSRAIVVGAGLARTEHGHLLELLDEHGPGRTVESLGGTDAAVVVCRFTHRAVRHQLAAKSHT